MNITRALVAVYVYPEFAGRMNVVRRVHWLLKFEQDGFSSDAYVETFLNVDNITNFIPANEIGTDQVLQWAFDTQGGDEFVDTLRPYHAEQIAYQKSISGQQSYTDGFDFIVQTAAPTVPSSVL
jgi:hypothetical protein